MDLFVSMKTFVEVVQGGSMSAAARSLNVTSALVGQRVAMLEEHLKIRLLNRTTRQHSLTEFGLQYFEQCQDILELVATSEGNAIEQQAHPQGRLRLAAPVSFGCEALTPALKGFAVIAPKVDIELILSDNNEDLIAGRFDAAFRIGRLEDSTLLQTRLSPYKMMLVASPDYLNELGHPRVPADIGRFSAVLFSKTGHRPWRFSKATETQNWTPRAMITVNSGQAVRNAVIAGMGIAMLPQVLVKNDLKSGSLVRVLRDWDLPEQPMSLIYHRDRYMPQRLSHFIAFAKATFG